MNIYEKIQEVKIRLLKSNIKKSGVNKFAGYNYYELADFTPKIIEFCTELKLFTAISFDRELAKLTIINSENPEERIEYTSPIEELELKGCNKIQALGGTETYSRRYLYMSAFDIIESDMFDGQNGAEDVGEKIIDKNKVATLGMIAKDKDVESCKAILSEFGYTNSKEVKVKDFKQIYERIKAL